MSQEPAAPTMDQWQKLYDDQEGLVANPEGRRRALMVLAESLSAQGLIKAGELADLYEQADAAYAWGVEEQISSAS
jgi:hypothetical protein